MNNKELQTFQPTNFYIWFELIREILIAQKIVNLFLDVFTLLECYWVDNTSHEQN